MHLDPLIDDGAFFLHRDGWVRQLWDAAGVHGYILIGGQFLFDALRS